jgi:hypothetical protein
MNARLVTEAHGNNDQFQVLRHLLRGNTLAAEAVQRGREQAVVRALVSSENTGFQGTESLISAW